MPHDIHAGEISIHPTATIATADMSYECDVLVAPHGVYLSIRLGGGQRPSKRFREPGPYITGSWSPFCPKPLSKRASVCLLTQNLTLDPSTSTFPEFPLCLH